MTKQPEFDIYPQLDKDIEFAGKKQADDGLSETVSNEVEESTKIKAEQALPEDIQRWFQKEFPEAQNSWARKYSNFVEQVPLSIELEQISPSFEQTIRRLFTAKQVLSSANYLLPGESLPEGRTVGESMHLVMIPWQEFRNHIEDTHFMDWLKDLRRSQGQDEDDFDEELAAAIMINRELLVDPDDTSKRLTARQYLDKKIASDGPWGVMLIQDSKKAGVADVGPPLRNVGEDVTLAEQRVGALGIFEWLSLTLQKESRFPFDIGWLPAVRLGEGSTASAGCGYYNDDVIKNRLADESDSGLYNVRLAVA